MRPLQLRSLLVTAYKNRRQVLVKGPPGGGKSDIVSQAVKEVGADFIIEHPAVSDPTDYKGMPAILPNEIGRASCRERV